jgi:nucleotide-binding universal stress UspA family protein
MTGPIVLPVDDAPAAGRATELLTRYRGDSGQLDIVALNVQPALMALWPDVSVDFKRVEEGLLAIGRDIAERSAARLGAAGLSVERVVRLGLPADTIVREAQSREARLIVMGTRGEGALRGFAIGSVAMRVAHGSNVPVCLVKPDSKLPPQLGRSMRVLLALDGSEPALRAAETLVSWRGCLGALDVQIAYVQPPLTVLETVFPPHDDVIGQWSTQAGEEAVRPARERFAREGIRHHLHLSVGDAAVEIVHLADETGCELVVMGTRGRGAAHHTFVGSVALKVAAHASVPVVLVK